VRETVEFLHDRWSQRRYKLPDDALSQVDEAVEPRADKPRQVIPEKAVEAVAQTLRVDADARRDHDGDVVGAVVIPHANPLHEHHDHEDDGFLGPVGEAGELASTPAVVAEHGVGRLERREREVVRDVTDGEHGVGRRAREVVRVDGSVVWGGARER